MKKLDATCTIFPFEKIGCPLHHFFYEKIEILFHLHLVWYSINMFTQLYQRGFYGRSRFVWTPDVLGIIVRGYFQFHRSVPSVRRVSLVQIAPHLRALIRDYVKSLVCDSHDDENRFERICARWVRLPSLGAVLLKLRECYRIVHTVNSLCPATYESLRDDRAISLDFYEAITRFISLRSAASHSDCRLHMLPALPRPSSLPSHGSCFFCGAGLADKIDWNFLPKCSCACEEEVCVCSVCLDIFADDD